MTFVIVGGGFSGVETTGELNDFIHESIKDYYHNLNADNVRIILVNSGEKLLPEVPVDLAEFALHSLRENGVKIKLNTRISGVSAENVMSNTGSAISCHILIWTGGVGPDSLISKITECNHDKPGKIMTNNHLQVQGLNNVFSIGDCAFIPDPNTGKSCPPTAQHAIKQAKVVFQNLISIIQEEERNKNNEDDDNRKNNGHKNPLKMGVFDYKSKGIMTLIVKKNGVGVLLGYKIHGFLAAVIWRFYYLGYQPTSQKKMSDGRLGGKLSFKRDVTRLQINFKRKYSQSNK